MSELTWTNPYYGVQHLVKPAPGIRQITSINQGEWAEVWALGMEGFTEFWKETHDTIEQAREAGEAKARSFMTPTPGAR